MHNAAGGLLFSLWDRHKSGHIPVITILWAGPPPTLVVWENCLLMHMPSDCFVTGATIQG